jgi:hypothetical protein
MIVQAAHEGTLLGKPCACETDPHWWEVMEEQITAELAPGHVLTYGGTTGPDTSMDHAVVHVWHVDWAPRVSTPSTYVEPSSVAAERKAAFDAYVHVPYVAPEPVPYDFAASLVRPEPRAWPENDPAPEHTTRDPFPDMPLPTALAALKKKAEAAGWEVRVGYSRAKRRAVKIGSYDLVETLGVWGEGHGWRFSAMYERKPEGAVSAQAWKWGSISLWADGKFPFSYASVTDLKEWLAVRGSVLPSWFAAIAAREKAKAEKQKAAAKTRPASSNREAS